MKALGGMAGMEAKAERAGWGETAAAVPLLGAQVAHRVVRELVAQPDNMETWAR